MVSKHIKFKYFSFIFISIIFYKPFKKKLKKKIEMQRESHGTRITLNGIDKNALSPLFYNIIIKMVKSIRTRLDVWEY